MKKVLAVVLNVFLFSSLGFSAGQETENGGIVRSANNWGFFVQAPKGWVLDNESGVSEGLHAVFYPKGSSWEKSPVVMYAQTFKKPETGDSSLAKFIEEDMDNFRAKSPNIKIKVLKPIPTGDKKQAQIRDLTGDRHNSHELIAYIEEKEGFAMIVFHADNEKLFKQSNNAFSSLVSRYLYTTIENK
jgi:hypothetical protein